MRSPNFKTSQIIRPSFGIEDHSYGYDENDASATADHISDMYHEAKLMAEEVRHELSFHSIQVEAGYHSGFQIYVRLEIDADHIFDDLRVNDDDMDNPYIVFTDMDGYEVDDANLERNGAAFAEQDVDEAGNLVFNEDGYPVYSVVADFRKIEELIEEDEAVAFHHVAVISQKLGLAPIQGSDVTWTSRVSDNHEENAKLIDSLLIPELLKKNAPQSLSPSP